MCQVKKAKKITAKPSNIYADPLHGLEFNEAYETNIVITKGNVAYASNTDGEQNKPSPSNMDMKQSASKPEISIGAVNEYADYHVYDSI